MRQHLHIRKYAHELIEKLENEWQRPLLKGKQKEVPLVEEPWWFNHITPVQIEGQEDRYAWMYESVQEIRPRSHKKTRFN